MEHIATDSVSRDDVPSDKRWLHVSDAVMDIIRPWVGRSGVLAFVGPENAVTDKQSATAMFTPDTQILEVNSTEAFGEYTLAEEVGDMRTKETQREYKKATGMIYHEAMHARHSTMDLRDMYVQSEDRMVHRCFLDLEEIRIEHKGLKLDEDMAPFLRASALAIAVPGDDVLAQGMGDTWHAAAAANLVIGRHTAGVLDEHDVRAVRRAITPVIPEAVLQKMEEVYRDYIKIDEKAFGAERKMIKLAKKLHKIITEQAKSNGEPDQEEMLDALKKMLGSLPPMPGVPGDDEEDGDGGKGEPGDGKDGEDGEPGEGEGEGDGKPSEGQNAAGQFAQALAQALDAAQAEAETGAQREIREAEMREKWEQAKKAREEVAQEKGAASAQAAKVFDGKEIPNKPQKATNWDAYGDETQTRSRLTKQRPPTGPERQAALKVAKALDRAKYRDKEKAQTNSVTPPGRLRTRAAVQGAAYKKNGVSAHVEPFRQIKKRHVDETTLTLGMITDISGSMSGAMEPMGVTAWIFSEAVRRIAGTAAAAYFGASVFPTLKPGQHLETVNIYNTPDGTHRFNEAFMAIDGALNLLHGTGARLLVVNSDGAFEAHQQKAVLKWLKRCEQAGVGVLWIGPGEARHGKFPAEIMCEETNAEFIAVEGDILETANVIAAAAEKAITEAGKARAL